MGIPVVVVPSGGLPITVISSGGLPMTVSTAGGIAVTVVASGGLPVTGVSTGPDVTAPVIVSASAISQPENTALTHYLMANEAVTWAKVGGTDNAKFTLASGVLTLPAKDYELPDDSNADRAYVVQVQATDLASNVSAVQTITVTITNVADTVILGPVIDMTAASDTGSSSTDDITSVASPIFTIDLAPTGAVAGNTLYIYDGGSQIASHVLTAPEISGGSISLGLPALSETSHAITAKVDVSGALSNASNTVTVTIDTTAPTITSSASPIVAENVILNHALTASETVTWTKTGGADAAAFTLTGSTLTLAAKDYETQAHTWVVQVTATDVAGNATNQTITATITDVADTDVTAPVLSSPTGTQTGATTATLTVSTDEGNGTLYGVLTLVSTPPSKAQIKAGQNASGAAAAYAFNQAVSTTGVQTKNATGLTASTTYFAFYMHEDGAANQSNVPTVVSFTTAAGASSTTLDPAKKHALAVLSNGNLTVTHTDIANAYHSVLSVAGHSTGKYHFEVFMNLLGSPPSDDWGVGTASADLANYAGANAESAGAAGDGTGYLAGTFPGAWGPAVATGDTLAIELDLDASPQIIRFAKGTGAWSADRDISSITGTGPYYAMAALFVMNEQVTFNFGATAFVKTPTVGFGPF